jgi:SAM-dependent methyltransferase
MRTIEYLSSPAPVSMADQWFRISTTTHFWVRRRFEVLHALAGSLLESSQNIAEIGCGHGLVQSQIEEAYGHEVTGFDLNEFALQQNQSRSSSIFCYDICQRAPQFHRQFDFVVMFDVLEHIDDQDLFLEAAMFHLSPGGYLMINVPAGQWLYSSYDRAAGHVRRYSIRTLRDAAKRNHYEVGSWTYWGFPLLPLAVLRKFWLIGSDNQENTISTGFDSRGNLTNTLLGWLSRCESIPQQILGTSLMAVLTPNVAKLPPPAPLHPW